MTESVAVLETGARALRRLVRFDGFLDGDRVDRELRRAGCQAGLISTTVAALQECKLLLRDGSDRVALSPRGRETARALQDRQWDGYARDLLALPSLRSQLELSVVAVVEHGSVVAIDRSRLPARARELAVVLSWMSSLDEGGLLVALADDWLETLELTVEDEAARDWVTHNEIVGYRAERYSLLLLRSTYPPSTVAWVASESDRFGYDIEVRTDSTELAIEVKGSSSRVVRFFLSRNERRVARDRGRDYVVQFWGDIDLSASPLADFRRLRALGYPHEFLDPESLIASDRLLAEASAWSVRLPPNEAATTSHG